MPSNPKCRDVRSDLLPSARTSDLAFQCQHLASLSLQSKKRVLLAEDEVLIGMLIEDEFLAAGFEIVGPFSTCVAASKWLKSNSPDAAVLDYRLADGPCTHVAVELMRRGIPFVTVTASAPRDLPSVMRNVPGLTKPNGMERLSSLLESLMVTTPMNDRLLTRSATTIQA